MKKILSFCLASLGFAVMAMMTVFGLSVVNTYAADTDVKVGVDGTVSVTVPTEVNTALMADGTVVTPSGLSIKNNEGIAVLMEAYTDSDYGYPVDYTLDVGGTRVLSRMNRVDTKATKPLEFTAGESKEMKLGVSKLSREKHEGLIDAAAGGTASAFRMGFKFKPKEKQAFAVYSADDKSLNFYKRYEVPEQGSQFEGKTVTDIYTGIETTAWSNENKVIVPWYAETGGVPAETLSVTVVDDISPISCSGWFYNFKNAKTIDVAKLDTSSVTNMYAMFNNCNALTSLDVSNFDTSNVTNMKGMFRACQALASIDVSNFDISNVTNISYMFDKCYALKTLNTSGWRTSKVTTMRTMFQNCQALTSLDVSGWDTSNVTDMAYMFNYCNALKTLNTSGWRTSKVTNMAYMFQECNALTSLDVSGWDTSNVTDMSCMFNKCYALKTLNTSGWRTSKVTDMKGLFQECNALTSLDVSGWDTSNVTSMSHMFNKCYELKALNVSGWRTSKVTTMRAMFQCCYVLTSLDVSGWDTSNVTNMGYMFNKCHVLTSLDVSRWDTSNVTDMAYMFQECNALTSLDVSGWDTSNVTNMTYMFYNCNNLKIIKTPYNIKMPTMTNITSKMFYDESDDYKEYPNGTFPTNITTSHTLVAEKPITYEIVGDTWLASQLSAYCNNFNRIAFVDTKMPSGVTQIPGVDADGDNGVVAWTTTDENGKKCVFISTQTQGQKVIAPQVASGMFYAEYVNTSDVEYVDVGNLDVSQTIDMSRMFSSFGSWSNNGIEFVGLETWDTSRVQNMSGMFSGVLVRGYGDVVGLNITDWNVENVRDFSEMFAYQSYHNGERYYDLSNWNARSAVTVENMFAQTTIGWVKLPKNIPATAKNNCDFVWYVLYDKDDNYKEYRDTIPVGYSTSHMLVNSKPNNVMHLESEAPSISEIPLVSEVLKLDVPAMDFSALTGDLEQLRRRLLFQKFMKRKRRLM